MTIQKKNTRHFPEEKQQQQQHKIWKPLSTPCRGTLFTGTQSHNKYQKYHCAKKLHTWTDRVCKNALQRYDLCSIDIKQQTLQLSYRQ